MGHVCLECPGRFWWGTKGFHTEIGFPLVGTTFRFPCIRLELAIFATSRSVVLAFLVIFYITSMTAFTSTLSIPAAQLADAPQLEPAFEHLLRNSSVHESVIGTLRVNAITDRDTFVNMFDSEAALKEGASDLGFDLTTGGLPHKREFARVVTSWKTAKVMSETKLQTDAVARAHGVPVTLLPCDWTSLVTEFKNKFGKHVPDDKLPAQSMFEKFSERLADGTLKAELLSHVVSLFEEEQQDNQTSSSFFRADRREGTPPQVFDLD